MFNYGQMEGVHRVARNPFFYQQDVKYATIVAKFGLNFA